MSNYNNAYDSFPPLMSDSRLFTHYEPINNSIIEKNNIKSNYEYRQFLMKHGDSIRVDNKKNACDQTGYCQFQTQTDFHNKYLYKGLSDTTQPYGYETSDLKANYISSQSLNSRLYAPIMTQDKLLRSFRDK